MENKLTKRIIDMKRVLYIISAALIVASSCSKYEQPAETNEVKMVSATINAESGNTGDGSKTTAAYNADTKKYNITWEEGDKLSVFNTVDATNSMFSAVYLDQAGRFATFNGEIPESSEVKYAILPYDKDATVSGSTVYTSIPTEQDGDFGNIVLAGWPKPELETKANLDFKYQFEAVCGILKFTFDPDKVGGKKIVSVDITTDTPIAGPAKISYSEEGKPTMTPNTGSDRPLSNTITITKEEGFTAGDYYFATFPIAKADVGTTSITLRFITEDDQTAYVSATLPGKNTSDILLANVVKNIGTVSVSNYNPMPGGGEFSVTNNKKVSFSPGNLQYQASTNTWRFAPNQWDAQNTLGNSVPPTSNTDDGARATQSEWIDLFRWGHSGWTRSGRQFKPTSAGNDELSACWANLSSKTLTGQYQGPGDWGVYNDIKNGTKTDKAGKWRLLTHDEANYLIFNRQLNNKCTELSYTVDSKEYKVKASWMRCFVNVSGERRYCLLIFPDVFTWPAGIDIPYIKNEELGTIYDVIGYKNISDDQVPEYNFAQISKFEKAGCAILPCAGQRTGFAGAGIDLTISGFNTSGYYFTSSADQIAFWEKNIGCNESYSVGKAFAVRLVKNGTGF